MKIRQKRSEGKKESGKAASSTLSFISYLPILVLAIIFLSLPILITAQTAETAGANQTSENHLLDEMISKKQAMAESGFSVTRIDDYIQLAEERLNSSDEEGAGRFLLKANETINLAYQTKTDLDFAEEASEKAKDMGINTTLADKYLADARIEMITENYEGAETLIAASRQELWKKIDEFPGLEDALSRLASAEKSYFGSENISAMMQSELGGIKQALAFEKIPEYQKKASDVTDALEKISTLGKELSDFDAGEQPYSSLSSILELSANALKQGDIYGAKNLAEDFEKQKSSFIEAQSYINMTKKALIDVDVGGKKTEFIANMQKAEAMLESGDFFGAETLAKKTYANIEAIKSEKIISDVTNNKPSIYSLVKKHLALILAAIILASIFLAVFFGSLKKFYFERRKKYLERRIATLEKILKDTQRRYFKEKSLSRERYEYLTDNYQEKIVQAREDLFLGEKNNVKEN